ncbi:hypothetical protein ABZ864_47985 [Streptomyces sp. NPDC047082]|uniref:hypothetical protein n=1 Tax=Streptomyces sp. NPDC047082 TaxID=3155259 RepID=UPI0033DEFAAF
MAIELPDDLISAQRAADEAHRTLLGLQRQFAEAGGEGTLVPAREWPEDQRSEWDAQQREWRRLAEIAQAAVTEHAKDQGLGRYDVEAALRQGLRHPQPTDG